MQDNTSYDLDSDGVVNEKEIEIVEEKLDAQRRMAWTAMGSMLFFTLFLFLPIVEDSRVSALADLLGLFYIGQASVVGAYMGFSAYMNNKKN